MKDYANCGFELSEDTEIGLLIHCLNLQALVFNGHPVEPLRIHHLLMTRNTEDS